ncbi:MscL family protein [Rothia sp. SD9660Na]|uniref:MscL family protein n=1 Tax=Rothia sp. SD9660Na TaxID=3047030 RepID=UPI0032D8C33A
MVDLAVGMSIGTAYTAVVTTLVDPILMPAISCWSAPPPWTSSSSLGRLRLASS